MLDSYAAGLFDGEGTVTFSHYGNHFTMRARVTNTNHEVLLKLKQKYGGSVFPHPSTGKPAWCWQVAASYAVEFLRSVLPYLIIKRDAARCGLKLQATNKKGRGRYAPVPPEILTLREILWTELKSINHRGVIRPSA